jgi:hypothetical protein
MVRFLRDARETVLVFKKSLVPVLKLPDQTLPDNNPCNRLMRSAITSSFVCWFVAGWLELPDCDAPFPLPGP